MNGSATASWTSTRWTDTHDWPAWAKPVAATALAAASQSPSASTITGELLPSSRATFLRPALSLIPQPTSPEPVKVR